MNASKTCTKCGEVKPLDSFPRSKKARDGKEARCKVCAAAQTRAYALMNPDKAKSSQNTSYLKKKVEYDAKRKQWHQSHPEKRSEHRKTWREKNIEKAREIEKASYQKNHVARLLKKREYAETNRSRYARYTSLRRAALLNATPRWVDVAALDEIYQHCADRKKATGIEHHVDHIVPLKHPSVCGLHVPWNLRVITGKSNRQKSNKFIESLT